MHAKSRLRAALCGLMLAALAASPVGAQIVGGQAVSIDTHPWQVALNIHDRANTYFCGGTIIAPKWVLTAAHCFKTPNPPAKVEVKSGATHFETEGVWVAVERVFIHKAYNSRTQANDIALIKLKSPATGTPLALAGAEPRLSASTLLAVSGWGATSEGGTLSHVLREAKVPFVDTATCNAPQAYHGQILPGMLCAGKMSVDACQGDSGGPLVATSPQGPVLVGVVSWGEGCAEQFKYGVYTQVSAFRGWISRVMRTGRQ